MPTNAHCCCCPDTKEGLGLPDVINVAFSVASTDCSGMPSNSAIGLCGANTIYAEWRCDSALLDLITSLDFEFVSGPTGDCCFLFRTAGTEQPCPDTGSDYTLVGQSPFYQSVTADSFQKQYHRDNVSVDPDPLDPGACCPNAPSTYDCEEICGWGYLWENGEVYTPRNVYAKGELRICVDGSNVTISIVLSIVATYDYAASAGTAAYNSSSVQIIDCSIVPEEYTNVDGDVTCASVGGHIYIDVGPQDVSGESGTTIWDKIKAATWTAEYEYAICGVGGGCSGFAEIISNDCEINQTCLCVDTNPVTEVNETDHPVDQDCIYSAGTVSLVFSDG